MAEKPTRYRIGYALAPKKIHSFIQQSLLDLAEERGIDLVQIQPTKPLLDQTPFDCIIHKSPDPEWHNNLDTFISQNPDVAVIDHPDAIERLHSRTTMLEAVSHLKLPPELSLETPRQVFFGSPESSLSDSVASAGINFPVIAKPEVADGSAGSHQMYLVFDPEGLQGLDLEPPFVLQEFVNHGGVIFKVYVAGKHAQCVNRPSLPDISAEKSGLAGRKVVPFSQISNVGQGDGDDDVELRETTELPPPNFVDEVASQLRRALKLNLFNFDMIRDTSRVGGGRYLVIDINYFPGYAKMPSYEKILTDFFLDIAEHKVETVI